MTTRKIDFSDTRAFSSFFLDYIQQKDSLKKFYGRFPLLDNFGDQLKDKASFSQAKRTLLADVLTKQYSQLTISESVRANIDSLRDNKTFTVTTGHQLNVFTGPLYFIFKIVTIINACKSLKEKYPAYHFVPLYWMASEDHDYEEIKSFRLYGTKYTWQTEQQGAVGRFETKDFKNLINQLPGDVGVFKTAYEKNKTLASAVRQYVNALFGAEGLVVVDGDDRQLKSLFTQVIQDDLFNHTAKKVVDLATQELQSLGYHTQVNARDINLFYLDDGVRSRLEREGDTFKVVDSTLSFSKSDIEKMILAEPEKFSPNVVLRPLYQEMILPNLAYAGGPAELVYWLQLKGVFEFFQTPFPVLMPRNFGLVVDAPTQKKFSKTGLDIKDLFQEKNYLFNHWVANNSKHDLSLGKHMQSLQSLFSEIQKKATAIDSTLTKLVAAENHRALNGLERIEKKMLKAEKRKHEEKRKQIESAKDALFPHGSLQERTDNFLNFYQSDPAFIQKLLAAFDAFDFRFNVLMND